MALNIEWSERALLHLEEILNYWENRNKSKAYSLKLYSWIQTSLELLALHPASGKRTENIRLHKKIIKDYYLYYTFDSTTLTVIGIIDMRRDPEYLRKFDSE